METIKEIPKLKVRKGTKAKPSIPHNCKKRKNKDKDSLREIKEVTE